MVEELLRDERCLERRGGARVIRSGCRLVGDELGLDDDAQRLFERLDLVEDRRAYTLDEGDEPRRPDANGGARR
jgi:hypothetical protein